MQHFHQQFVKLVKFIFKQDDTLEYKFFFLRSVAEDSAEYFNSYE